MTARRARMRGQHEDGFTLVELVISVTIMMVIVGSVGFALVAVMRTQQDTTDRMSTSQAEQLTTKWFGGDVQVATEKPNIASATVSGCLTNPGTANVVRFATKTAAGATTYVVAYRAFTTTAGEKQLIRVACIPGAAPDVLVLAHNFDTAAVVLPAVFTAGQVVNMDVTVKPMSGTAAGVCASTTTTAASTAGCFTYTVTGMVNPTTVALTTTTVANPTPSTAGTCTGNLVLNPTSAQVQTGGTLNTAIGLTATLTGGLCASEWAISYTPSSAVTTPTLIDLTGSGASWTGTIPATSSGWNLSDGSRPIALVPKGGGTAVDSEPLTLTAPPTTTTTTAPTTTIATTTTTAPTTTTTRATTTTTATSRCVLTAVNTGPNSVKIEPSGILTQEVRVVMEPSTNTHYCHDAAVRFTDKNGVVYVVKVVDEGQNVTAKITTNGAWRFGNGKTYTMDIIDTSAGNVKVGGVNTSSFSAWQ